MQTIKRHWLKALEQTCILMLILRALTVLQVATSLQKYFHRVYSDKRSLEKQFPCAEHKQLLIKRAKKRKSVKMHKAEMKPRWHKGEAKGRNMCSEIITVSRRHRGHLLVTALEQQPSLVRMENICQHNISKMVPLLNGSPHTAGTLAGYQVKVWELVVRKTTASTAAGRLSAI